MTKTHLYGLTQPSAGSKSVKNGMAKIAVRHPLSSVIKIATKSACPEIISFTYGDKQARPKSKVDQEEKAIEGGDEANGGEEPPPEYDIKGKDWFFIPDYAGEAASAVKMRILEIADLISN